MRLRAGGEKFVLVHVEFESSRKERDFPRRMFGYFCLLFLKYGIDVVAVAMFSDDAIWKQPVDNYFEASLSPRSRVRFDYHVIKLKHLDHKAFLASPNPLAFALMAKMNYEKRQRVRLKADFRRMILGAKVDPARENLLLEFVETYMILPQAEQTQFLDLVRHESPYVEVLKMVTTYEQAGIKKGIQKGIEEGIEQGKQAALMTLLEKRFGKLPTETVRKIHRLRSSEKLDALLLAVLDATSLSDLPL